MSRKLALALAGLLIALGSLGIPQLLQANDNDRDLQTAHESEGDDDRTAARDRRRPCSRASRAPGSCCAT